MNGIIWKVLMVINCVNSLAGKGIFKDAEGLGKDCVRLPCQYFQKLLVPISDEDSHDDKANDITNVSTKL